MKNVQHNADNLTTQRMYLCVLYYRCACYVSTLFWVVVSDKSYCDKSVPMTSEVFNDADDSPFEGIMKNCNHELHAYLPERRDSS